MTKYLVTILLSTGFLTALILGFIFEPTILLVGSILLALGLGGWTLVFSLVATAAWMVAAVTTAIFCMVAGICLLAIQNEW